MTTFARAVSSHLPMLFGFRTTRHIVAIGHSHMFAIEKAYKERLAKKQRSKLKVDFIQLWDPLFDPPLTDGALHPKAIEALSARRYDAVVSVVAGNCYNFISFIRQERAFDFIPPDRPDLPVDENAELIPYRAMQRRMVEVSDENGYFAALPAIRAATSLPMLHVESPPPIASEPHILAHPHGLEDLLNRFGPAPATLRHKLWQLQSTYYRDVCRDLDIQFVPAPREMQDENGFLIEKAFPNDSQHANSLYGEAVLSQLESLI